VNIFCVVREVREKRSLKSTALNNLRVELSILIIHVVGTVMKYKLIFMLYNTANISVDNFCEQFFR